jgi:glutathione S-transferase
MLPDRYMKLYYSPGACSLAPHIALREAERTFELVRVDLHTNRLATGEDYRLANPKGEVPALVLDGPGSDLLTENVAILLYIADLVPDRMLAPPSGTFARYHMIEMLSYLANVHAEFSPLFHPETPAPVAERHRGKIGEAFLYLQKDLEDKGYLMGETFTVADCYMFPLLRWCERFGMSLQIWPNLDYYYQRVVERPTVQAALGAEGLLAQHRVRRSA